MVSITLMRKELLLQMQGLLYKYDDIYYVIHTDRLTISPFLIIHTDRLTISPFLINNRLMKSMKIPKE
jgi:hypothetical protein